MSIFEKMFGRKRQGSETVPVSPVTPEKLERKPLVPDFAEEPELDLIVEEIRNAERRTYAATVDGSDEEAKQARAKVAELYDKHRVPLQRYLAPYRPFAEANLTYQEKVKQWGYDEHGMDRKEHGRYMVAGSLWK